MDRAEAAARAAAQDLRSFVFMGDKNLGALSPSLPLTLLAAPLGVMHKHPGLTPFLPSYSLEKLKVIALNNSLNELAARGKAQRESLLLLKLKQNLSENSLKIKKK